MAEEISEKIDRSLDRDKTMPVATIDEKFYVEHAERVLSEFQETHVDYFRERDMWLSAARDLRHQWEEGPFENNSDIHIPFIFTMAKAIHARLYEAFGQSQGFYSVEARNGAYEERENTIKYFMDYYLSKVTNRGDGFKPFLDRFLDDLSYEGTAIGKLTWDIWEYKYKDVEYETVTEEQEEIFVDEAGDIQRQTIPVTRIEVKDKDVEVTKSAPRIGAIDLGDFKMPPGHCSPNMAPWCSHEIYMTDEQMKEKARQGKWDEDAVEEAITHRTVQDTNQNDRDVGKRSKDSVGQLEGISNHSSSHQSVRYDTLNHEIVEFYTKAYVKKEVSDGDMDDVNERQEEIVFWYHKASRIMLGWTYLHRIAPDGKRPFFKADFIPARQRAFGIGIGELLYSLNMYMDAMHQLKMDNGLLASLQFGVYRASSPLKPDTFRIEPGELVPVEDPNDVNFTSFPYLGTFGQEEEAALRNYATELLPVNDVILGNLGQKGVAGALRNATGASFVDRQSNIQLNPHLDRIALPISNLLNAVFVMCRERMPNQMFFRVTGEDGSPVFGEVSRQDLMGDYDFNIEVDIMGASEAEKQQRATLMMQTLLNPTWMQLGLVTPENYYEVLKQYLTAHNVKRLHKYITKPMQYQGPVLTTNERLFRIASGLYDHPRIEDTVRLEEDHNSAIAEIDAFMESDLFGAIQDPKALAALQSLYSRHQQMLQVMNNPNPVANASGTQMPNQGGLPALEAGGDMVGQGSLATPEGEVNGPVF